MLSTLRSSVTKAIDGDFMWLIESVVLGTGAALLIFNGMPVVGAAVAIVAND